MDEEYPTTSPVSPHHAEQVFIVGVRHTMYNIGNTFQ